MVPRLAHVLDLEGGFGEVWNHRFTGTARTAASKAERSGLTVERDTTGRLMPAVYELFERSLDRWAEQGHEPPALALGAATVASRAASSSRWRERSATPAARGSPGATGSPSRRSS
jgi:hypothetical protein